MKGASSFLIQVTKYLAGAEEVVLISKGDDFHAVACNRRLASANVTRKFHCVKSILKANFCTGNFCVKAMSSRIWTMSGSGGHISVLRVNSPPAGIAVENFEQGDLLLKVPKISSDKIVSPSVEINNNEIGGSGMNPLSVVVAAAERMYGFFG